MRFLRGRLEELQLCGDGLDALLDDLQRTRLVHVLLVVRSERCVLLALLAVRSCGRAGANAGGNSGLGREIGALGETGREGGSEPSLSFLE